jgi:hypothetical protein
VKNSGINPYHHYIEYGFLEGRLPNKFWKLPTINYKKINSKLSINFNEINLVIPTFNNPTYLKQYINQILKYPKIKIIIYDNNSTYKPMLALLNQLEKTYLVYRKKENFGPEYVYQDKNFLNLLPHYFLLSDPDLELNPNLPSNFYEIFYAVSNFFKVGKVGCALTIPNNFKTNIKLKQKDVTVTAYDYEMQFWKNKIGYEKESKSPIYSAALGATMSLINLDFLTIENHWNRGARIAGDFECRHLPWELDFSLPEEELNFYNNSQKFSFYTPK